MERLRSLFGLKKSAAAGPARTCPDFLFAQTQLAALPMAPLPVCLRGVDADEAQRLLAEWRLEFVGDGDVDPTLTHEAAPHAVRLLPAQPSHRMSEEEASESVAFDLAALFPTMDWTRPGTVRVACGPQGAHARFVTRLVRRWSTFKIERGQTVEGFTFHGHSHKETMPGGPASPLIIGATYNGASFHASVFDKSPFFKGGGQLFYLDSYEYNHFMVISHCGPQ